MSMVVDSVTITIERQGLKAKFWVQGNPGRMVMFTQEEL
jgi:hypothetical protein